MSHAPIGGMTNGEIRMTKQIRKLWSAECGVRDSRTRFRTPHSALRIRHCLLIVALSFSTLAAESPSTNVVVPFEFQRDHITVRVSVNQSEPLLFMLDTGYAMNMISPEQANALGLKRAGKVTIIGVAGEEPADMFEGPTFDFGIGMTYTSRRVAALASHSQRYARRDGVLGAGFYRRFVMEVDH